MIIIYYVDYKMLCSGLVVLVNSIIMLYYVAVVERSCAVASSFDCYKRCNRVL